MTFKTKINLSENRLFKQPINTNSKFEGLNEFSVPLEDRKLGGDYESSIKTIVDTDILTNFQFIEETNTLLIDFKNSEMESSHMNIPTIDFDNDDEVYFVYPNLVGYEPYEIFGVEYFNRYQGYEYEFKINQIEITEDGYIGTFYTPELIFVDAPSMDYKGDNVVVKINGFVSSDKSLTKIKYNIINVAVDDYKITKEKHFSNNLYVLDKSITISNDISIGAEINIIKNNYEVYFEIDSEIINTEKMDNFISLIKISDSKYIIK